MASEIPSGGDTVMEAVKWVFFVLVLIGSASVPFMMIMHRRNRDRNENTIETAISSAGSSLYTQLVKQVEEYRNLADTAFRERRELQDRVTKLEVLADHYEESKKDIAGLNRRLEEKDQEMRKQLQQAADERAQFIAILKQKDEELVRRDESIRKLESAVSNLNARLVRDETQQIFGAHVCPFSAAKAAGRKIPKDIEELMDKAAEDACATCEHTDNLGGTL